MESRKRILYLALTSLILCIAVYDMFLNQRTRMLVAEYNNQAIERQQILIMQQKKDAEFVKEHIEDIYKLSVLDSVRGYVTMDTLIRVFHYAKPHKAPVWNCPECADIRKKGLPNKQLPGERLKLPPTGPERTAHAISSSHKHGENN